MEESLACLEGLFSLSGNLVVRGPEVMFDKVDNRRTRVMLDKVDDWRPKATFDKVNHQWTQSHV